MGAVCLLLLAMNVFAQSAVSSPQATSGTIQDNFGIGVKVGLLGVGTEIAARVNSHSNLRAGFNVLGYSRTFNKDGISYGGHLSFRTIEAHYDYFPWARSFHISGGLLDYIGNPITANALVPADTSFSLGGQQYYSDSASPAAANGRVNFNQISPTVTFGWGNLVRENKHFSFPVEFGVAFQGSPKSTLSLAGSVCNQPSTNPIGRTCTPTSDPTVQANVLSEQAKLDNSMKPFKFYPIISFGFGYKF
jgi:hypothetical protein